MFVWYTSRKRKVVQWASINTNVKIFILKIACHQGEVVDQIVIVHQSGVQMKLECVRKMVKSSTGNQRK